MTIEECKSESSKLYKTYISDQRSLDFKYVSSIATATAGDIVEDMAGNFILVEKLVVSSSSSIPDYYYKGRLLKKDRTPRKDNKEDAVFSHYIKQVHKKQ